MSTLRFFDTYQKKLVELNSQNYEKKSLQIYTCGPTVYHYQHIGNIYAIFLGSILVDACSFLGFKVKWVSNITDVGHLVGDGDEQKNVNSGEDKLEKTAKENGLKIREVVNYYTDHFKKQIKLLHIDNYPENLQNPKATDYVSKQAQLAIEIYNNGLAYINKYGIYFDSTKLNLLKDLPNHEVFKPAEKSLKNDFVDRRIKGDSETKNPQDFALWRFVDPSSLQKWKLKEIPEIQESLNLFTKNISKEEQEYILQWGGPGWHAECVSMICAVFHKFGPQDGYNKLNKTDYLIDIHTGGEDHIPIHHKNEIIEASALGLKLSKYWLHNKHILVDNKKMSKSLGNSYLLIGAKKDPKIPNIIDKGFNPLSFRLMLFEHDYSYQINFTWDKLEQSQNRLYKLKKLSATLISKTNNQDLKNLDYPEIKSLKIYQNILGNNLNTPLFLEKFQQFLQESVDFVLKNDVSNLKNLALLKYIDEKFLKLDLFQIPSEDIYNIALSRYEYKKNKDYEKADKLRKELEKSKWEVVDLPWGFGLWQK